MRADGLSGTEKDRETNTMKTTTRLLAVLAGTTLLTQTAAAQELNALVWCDHTDEALIKPFEDKFGVKVNLKVYEGTGAALSLIEQSQPGDWDVLVVDGIDVPRVVEAGILAPLPVAELPYETLFPELVMEENHVIDGETYAISEKFGYNTVSFNSAAVSAEDLSDMTRLWSGDAPGSMAVYDYYLPVMGMVAMGLGIPTAEITDGGSARHRGRADEAQGQCLFGGRSRVVARPPSRPERSISCSAAANGSRPGSPRIFRISTG